MLNMLSNWVAKASPPKPHFSGCVHLYFLQFLSSSGFWETSHVKGQSRTCCRRPCGLDTGFLSEHRDQWTVKLAASRTSGSFPSATAVLGFQSYQPSCLYGAGDMNSNVHAFVEGLYTLNHLDSYASFTFMIIEYSWVNVLGLCEHCFCLNVPCEE